MAKSQKQIWICRSEAGLGKELMAVSSQHCWQSNKALFQIDRNFPVLFQQSTVTWNKTPSIKKWEHQSLKPFSPPLKFGKDEDYSALFCEVQTGPALKSTLHRKTVNTGKINKQTDLKIALNNSNVYCQAGMEIVWEYWKTFSFQVIQIDFAQNNVRVF